jgi:hypothetical protein
LRFILEHCFPLYFHVEFCTFIFYFQMLNIKRKGWGWYRNK